MYYLFFPKEEDLQQMNKELTLLNNELLNSEWIHFAGIKKNIVLPDCRMIKPRGRRDLRGVKEAVEEIMNRVEYKGPYQLLKLLSGEQCLI